MTNPVLLRTLYNDYYLKENNRQTEFLSSYWKIHSQQHDIKLFNEERGTLLYADVKHLGNVITKNPITVLLDYLCHLSYLIRLSDKKNILILSRSAIKLCRSLGFYFSFDCFKQVCVLNLIMKNLTDSMKKKHLTFLMVGDGYGFFSALLKHMFPNSTVVLVDIGRTLFLQAFYCQDLIY